MDNLFANIESIYNLGAYPVCRLTICDGPDFRWVNLGKHSKLCLLLPDKINDLCNYGLKLLKSRPAATLSRTLQLC